MSNTQRKSLTPSKGCYDYNSTTFVWRAISNCSSDHSGVNGTTENWIAATDFKRFKQTIMVQSAVIPARMRIIVHSTEACSHTQRRVRPSIK